MSISHTTSRVVVGNGEVYGSFRSCGGRTLSQLSVRTVNAVARRSFLLAKAEYKLNLCNPSRTNPVIVNSVRKVGTSSVAAALEVTLEGRSVAHVYWPRAEHLRAEEVHYKSRARCYCGKRQMSRFMPRYVWLGEQIGHAVKSAPPDTVWDVLTLVRSPVARNVSSATAGAVRFLRSRIPHDTKERK